MDKVPEDLEKKGQRLEMQDTGGRVETEEREAGRQDQVLLQVCTSSLEGWAQEAWPTTCH